MNLILAERFSTTMKGISKTITNWYSEHKRDLPWRKTQDAYTIWLSEIILQQTRVDQGMQYFIKFKEKYPTVEDLANAPQDEILKLWQGLGYYSRARNLHFTAKVVKDEFNGKFPTSYDDLIKLKGVGSYTAAAISSFSSNEPRAVVDGNVFRVLARLFNDETPINSLSGKIRFQAYADEILDKDLPGLHNQAIMEFGALQCTPKKPNCMYCPLQEQCLSFAKGTVLSLPKKEQKTKIRKRYFTYFIHLFDHKVAMRQRLGNDIWKGLFEFQLLEADEELEVNEVLNRLEIDPKHFTLTATGKPAKHVLSHQHIYAQFLHITWKSIPEKLPNDLIWCDEHSFQQLAIPRLIDRYLESSSPIFH